MSREEELEKEWREGVTERLVSIEQSLKNVEIRTAEMHASDVVERVRKLESKVSILESFKVKIVTAFVVIQVLIGGAWAIISNMF